MRNPIRPPAVEHDDDGCPVLHLEGEFDLSTTGELGDLLADAAASEPERIVIDLTDTTFMDLAGARPILEWRHRLPLERCSMVLRRPRPMVRMVLEVLGLDGPCIIDDLPERPSLIGDAQPEP